MKKIILVLVIVLCVVTLSAVGYANVKKLEAYEAQCPMVVDNKPLEEHIDKVIINDRLYLPVRAMCDLLDISIDWTDDATVVINTGNEGFEKAVHADYPIYVDSIPADDDITRYIIKDRLYLPVRSLGEILGYNIEWKEEGRVDITREDMFGARDFEISEDMALKIADVYYGEKMGKEFMENTEVTVNTFNDVYEVCRCPKEVMLDGDISIYIGKKDGRIIDVKAGG